MPYIDDKGREYWDPKIVNLLSFIDEHTPKGEVNYIITKICIAYQGNNKSYSHKSDVKGMLMDVRDEFGRRSMDPYEDKKKKENGDVYPEGD